MTVDEKGIIIRFPIRLDKKYGKDYVGLYRDDGLILLKGTS
jgi:hypothetical protein